MMQKLFIQVRALGFAFVMTAVLIAGMVAPTSVSAQLADTTQINVLNEQQLITQLILQIQELIVKLERQLTIERGQTPGENLINQNSVASTIGKVNLYSEPSYRSKISDSQSAGELGEVTAGPRLIAGEVWWEFEFRDEKRGWSPEKYFNREPSVVLRIDTDQDGKHDVSMRFIGEYDTEGFYVEPGEDGSYIRYRGDSVEPFSVTQL